MLQHMGTRTYKRHFPFKDIDSAALRLARFNANVDVVDKGFFQGLPSPAAAALVAGFVWLAVDQRMPVNSDWLPWLAMVITVYAGLTMVFISMRTSTTSP